MGAVLIAYQNEAGERRRISLDVEQELTFEGRSQFSEFPLQSGGSFQDHKTDLPDVFNLNGIVSKTPSAKNPGGDRWGSVEVRELQLPPMLARPTYAPIQYPAPETRFRPVNPTSPTQVIAALQGPDQPQPKRENEGSSRDSRATGAHGFWGNAATFENRCQVMQDELNEIRRKAYSCEVITGQHSGTDFQITSVVVTISAENGERADFQIGFSKIQQTELRQADVPIPAEVLATPISRSGSQAAKTDEEAKEEGKRESILRKLSGDGAGQIGKAFRAALGLGDG